MSRIILIFTSCFAFISVVIAVVYNFAKGYGKSKQQQTDLEAEASSVKQASIIDMDVTDDSIEEIRKQLKKEFTRD